MPLPTVAGNVPQYSEKNGVVAFLLCLFLGFTGIHRAYLGQYSMALVMLCSGGGAGFYWALDLIDIVRHKMRDAKELKVKFKDDNGNWPPAAKKGFEIFLILVAIGGLAVGFALFGPITLLAYTALFLTVYSVERGINREGIKNFATGLLSVAIAMKRSIQRIVHGETP